MRFAEWWRRQHAPSPGSDAIREAVWPEAMRAGRALSSAATLAVFVAAITLDDLHLFRFPTIYPGVLLAIGVFALTPPLFARRLVEHTLADHDARHRQAMAASLQRRRLLLVAAVAATVIWLVLFSSGATPRW